MVRRGGRWGGRGADYRVGGAGGDLRGVDGVGILLRQGAGTGVAQTGAKIRAGCYPGYVAIVAEKFIGEWVAAMAVIVRQLKVTVMTAVAFNVEVFIHGHDSHGFHCARCYGLDTRSTLWSICLMIVFDAVYLLIHINGKGNAIKALVADYTPEAAWMIGLAHRLKNSVHDQVTTHSTFLCCQLESRIQVIFLAVYLPMNIVKCFPSQCAATGAACEAGCVVEVAHSLACLACTCHLLSTLHTVPKFFSLWVFFQFFF